MDQKQYLKKIVAQSTDEKPQTTDFGSTVNLKKIKIKKTTSIRLIIV